ncbi:hypothetical protein C8R45DRAFT_1092079 [Mycena sanguinolenta]|nr:hypothetical protein C8R45DRAFT_1092079 [Mycena sanguinolenta]
MSSLDPPPRKRPRSETLTTDSVDGRISITDLEAFTNLPLVDITLAFGGLSIKIYIEMVFTPIQDAFPSTFKGQQAVFTIGSAVSLIGAIVTMLTIPANSIDLEEEDESWRDYLKRNGEDVKEAE